MIKVGVKTVEIKSGNMVLRIPRNDLAMIDETSDGICFKFKDGSYFYHVNQEMRNDVKRVIVSSIEKYVSENVIVDFNNHKMPIKLSAV